jgi:hypothetical protein
MKRVIVTALVSALLVVMVAVGGTSTAGKDPSSCTGICSPEECGAACTWDRSRWSGVQYSADGTVKGSLTQDQARTVVNQYLIGRGATEVCLSKIEATASTWVIRAHTPGGEYQITIAKKTAWVHQKALDPGC